LTASRRVVRSIWSAEITTLIDCYQQPDDDTLRVVVEYVKPAISSGVRRMA
jgi:hypothetical protein